MWYDEIPAGHTWASLWYRYVICGVCPGIRTIEGPCPVCGEGPSDTALQTVTRNGRPFTVRTALMGAEGRYEDYVYLQMLQREWERPDADLEGFSHLPVGERPSSRAAFVLLFWGYFETRIERLLRVAMHTLPQRVLDDALKRYSFIGARLYNLYDVFFGTNYFNDLGAQGYSKIADLLKDIHDRRNAFAHGKPQAINDATVAAVVENLKLEHESWIAVYNRRLRLPDGSAEA